MHTAGIDNTCWTLELKHQEGSKARSLCLKKRGTAEQTRAQPSRTHPRASEALSQKGLRHCACTGADHQTPSQYLSWRDHPQRPRSGSPYPCMPSCLQRRGSARWQHHGNAASAPHSPCLHIQHSTIRPVFYDQAKQGHIAESAHSGVHEHAALCL